MTNKLIYWGQRLRRGKGPRECVGGTYVRDNHQSSEEEIINSTYKCVMKREEDDGDDDEKEQQQVFDIFNQDVKLEIVCLTKHLCSGGGRTGTCLLVREQEDRGSVCLLSRSSKAIRGWVLSKYLITHNWG